MAWVAGRPIKASMPVASSTGISRSKRQAVLFNITGWCDPHIGLTQERLLATKEKQCSMLQGFPFTCEDTAHLST